MFVRKLASSSNFKFIPESLLVLFMCDTIRRMGHQLQFSIVWKICVGQSEMWNWVQNQLKRTIDAIRDSFYLNWLVVCGTTGTLLVNTRFFFSHLNIITKGWSIANQVKSINSPGIWMVFIEVLEHFSENINRTIRNWCRRMTNGIEWKIEEAKMHRLRKKRKEKLFCIQE